MLKQSTQPSSTKSVIVGAAFLMATSAIGPGFLTQTTVFTLCDFDFCFIGYRGTNEYLASDSCY